MYKLPIELDHAGHIMEKTMKTKKTYNKRGDTDHFHNEIIEVTPSYSGKTIELRFKSYKDSLFTTVVYVSPSAMEKMLLQFRPRG